MCCFYFSVSSFCFKRLDLINVVVYSILKGISNVRGKRSNVVVAARIKGRVVVSSRSFPQSSQKTGQKQRRVKKAGRSNLIYKNVLTKRSK